MDLMPQVIKFFHNRDPLYASIPHLGEKQNPPFPAARATQVGRKKDPVRNSENQGLIIHQRVILYLALHAVCLSSNLLRYSIEN